MYVAWSLSFITVLAQMAWKFALSVVSVSSKQEVKDRNPRLEQNRLQTQSCLM